MSVAVTSSLPSPLQLLTAVVKPVSMTLLLGLITLALFVAAGGAQELPAEWKTPPRMETFSSYEDMQRYFDYRNQRSLRYIANPSEDTYIAAFNYHNEQKTHRAKRSASEHKELAHKPTFIKFEMDDAVEPSDEVKELIRQYKSRTFQQNDKYLESMPSADPKNPIVKRAPVNNLKNNSNSQKLKSQSHAKHSTRPKRSTYYKQPANFKVQYIPFEVSDAREPDAQLKVLIKRMRALEMEKHTQAKPGFSAVPDSQITTPSTTQKPSTKRPKYLKLQKPKRSKRGAPELIKFELADARDSDSSSKTFINTKHTREAKDLKVDNKSEVNQESTQSKPNDQSAQASKRYFVYKEAPVKVKKSVSALPHDVQNILSHLIKGNSVGKANVKYIPGKQMDYRAYQAPKFGQAIYGHGGGNGGGFGKYAPAPIQAEKVRYVYHPVLVGGGGGVGGHDGGGGAGIKYIAAGGAGGHEAGGGSGVKYVVTGGGGEHAAGGDGGYGLKYIGAVGGEGGHAGGYSGGSGGGHEAGGGGGGAHVIQYVTVGGGEHGGGYAAAEGGGVGHGGGYAAAGGHGGSYALVHGAGVGAHVNYGGYAGHAGGYEADHGQAAAAIGHPIVVSDAGSAQHKETSYEGGYGESANTKNDGNVVIKNIPAPQFKAAQDEVYETKYSVVPTVEQYANTPTQEFKLKLYSPESLIAKAQLEAKDRAKAFEEQAQKAEAAAYAHAAGGGGFGGGGHEGGNGGGYGGGHLGGGGGKGEAAGPLIKIEYHAPADSLKENYKDIAEFKQLSSLVGKSPEDQIHGLTYLLAKEMQTRLHLQRQHNYVDGGHGVGGGGGEARPQDNKAPILFHPDAVGHAGGIAEQQNYQALSVAPGKYIGLSKSQQYVPVIEQVGAEVLKAGAEADGGEAAKVAAGSGPEGGEGAVGKISASKSYISYGISPNYQGMATLKGGSSAAHQSGHGQLGLGVGSYNGLHDAGYDEAAAKLQSYASKYAFGYRIRDFNTGNDFGHKQNRDLHGVTRGQYHILLPDGRIQNVIYHADDTGFHADVSFEAGH